MTSQAAFARERDPEMSRRVADGKESEERLERERARQLQRTMEPQTAQYILSSMEKASQRREGSGKDCNQACRTCNKYKCNFFCRHTCSRYNSSSCSSHQKEIKISKPLPINLSVLKGSSGMYTSYLPPQYFRLPLQCLYLADYILAPVMRWHNITPQTRGVCYIQGQSKLAQGNLSQVAEFEFGYFVFLLLKPTEDPYRNMLYYII